MESNNSYSCQGGSVPELKDWSHLCEEIKCVNEYVKEIQQLIKDDRYGSLITLNEAYDSASITKDRMFEQMRYELSLQLEDVKRKLRSLNEKYFTGKSGITSGSSGFDITDQFTSLVTPEQKLALPKSVSHEERLDVVSSSGGGSSHLSSKEGSASLSSPKSSSSDSDSDSVSCAQKHLVRKLNGDSDGMKENLWSTQHDVMLGKMKDAAYKELLERVADYEKQLKVANGEIKTLQEEMFALECKMTVEIDEVTKRMQNRLDSAYESVRELEAELALERHLVMQLQEKVCRSESDLSNHECEVKELNLALKDAQESFFKERSRFLTDISLLSEKQNHTVKKLEEAESKEKLLEDQIRELEAEKIRARDLYEAQDKHFLAEIERLRAELYEKCREVETLNGNFDAKKLDYDRLMAEKDEQTAKAQALAAQLTSQNIQIEQMQTRINQLETERAELVTGSEKRVMIESELRVRVEELKKEMDQQRAMILDRAEQKREAIRQLCFSLEYYRTEYHELCRAFKRHPVLIA